MQGSADRFSAGGRHGGDLSGPAHSLEASTMVIVLRALVFALQTNQFRTSYGDKAMPATMQANSVIVFGDSLSDIGIKC